MNTGLQKLHCEHNGRAKLSREDVENIFELWNNKVNQHEIARRFGVHRMTIHFIIKGKTWKKINNE